MKRRFILAALLAPAFIIPVHAQIEFVANGSSQLVTSIPNPSGPGTLGYYIFTDANDANTSNIGYYSTGTLADFAPTSYDTTNSDYSTLTIGGTSVQTADQEIDSKSNSVILGTITLGADAPSTFQLGFLEDNSDGAYDENENILTLSSSGSAPVSISAYNLTHANGVNDFYYIDILDALPGEVITITGSTQYAAVNGFYNIGFGGITFDAATPTTYTWTGAGDGTFDNSQGTSSPSNWTGGTGSNFPEAIDTAIFNVTSHTAVGFTGTDSAATLVFGSTGLNASSYTFAAGNTLNVGANLFLNAGVFGATETFNNLTDFTAGGSIVNQGSNTILNFSNITVASGTLILQGGQDYGSDPAGGRTINVTGSISGGGGITGNLAGAVANLENTNSYTGPTTMNSGILEYTGSASSGTPFGTGSIILNSGKLLLAPGGSGTDALTGGTASGSTLTYGVAGDIQLTPPAGGSLTYTVGSGTGTVFGSTGSSPTLIIETPTAAALGTTAQLVINGTAPTLTNGIVGIAVVGEDATTGYGSYLTYAGGTGFSDYTAATPLSGTTTSTGSSTGNYAVGAAGWTNDGSSIFLFNTLTVTNGTVNGTDRLQFDGNGDGAVPAGLILNNSAMDNALSLPDPGFIYVAGNSSLNNTFDSSKNVLSIFGPGTLTITAQGGGGSGYFSAFDLNGPGAISITNAGEVSGGASQTLDTTLVFNGGTVDTTATFALDGSSGAGTKSTPVTVNAGGGTFDVANNTTLAVTGIVGGTGPLYKTDSGTLISTGDNTYTGPLTIGAVNYQARDAAVVNPSTTAGGTLLLTGSNQATLTTVAGNGTRGSSVLGGTGSITATNNTPSSASGIFVEDGGTLAPGIINPNSTTGLTGLSVIDQSAAAVGTFSFTGAGSTESVVNLTDGGNFLWTLGDEKDGSTGVAGTDFSQLDISGNALLQVGGTSTLTLDLLSGINSTDTFWDSDHSWQIIDLAGGATSDGTNFNSITDADYGDGTFSTVNDGTGIELIYSVAGSEPVPEPSTWAMMILSGLGLLVYSRRFRTRNSPNLKTVRI